jgi:P-type Mg2+ transporter
VATSAFLGQTVDASIIALIVLLSTAIDSAQTYHSQRAVEKLRAKVAPTATVLRDGEWKELRRREAARSERNAAQEVPLAHV